MKSFATYSVTERRFSQTVYVDLVGVAMRCLHVKSSVDRDIAVQCINCCNEDDDDDDDDDVQ